MFRSVLIANRGEIALRIIRTLREMGIMSVAVYSDADRDAPFVGAADEAYRLGPSPSEQSYLSTDSVLSIARQAGVDAIHPGYGFLAENAEFAEATRESGITLVGPSTAAIRLMGDKVKAREMVRRLGVRVVPGSDGPVSSLASALTCAETIGYPVAVKAAGGGGGRGIRVVRGREQMQEALERASQEAATYFNNSEVYLEQYFDQPRHVEIQVLGDSFGKLIHMGERDCSVQRRHQKLIEETPSAAVDAELRASLGDAALRVAHAASYESAGTVEFLLTRDREYYFLEMNTRIQVEHPVTEFVTGVDLVREMVLIAAGEPTTIQSNMISPAGHAIEVRINAEDPANGFRPSPATIEQFRVAGGIGVRVDSGVEEGFPIPQEYDSLLAKLIVWAPDRECARLRALRAIEEFRIVGPATTLPFSRLILAHPMFIAGDIGTDFVEQHLQELVRGLDQTPVTSESPFLTKSERGERIFEVEVNRKRFTVRISEPREKVDSHRARKPGRRRETNATAGGAQLLSPMHGTVVAIKRATGEDVQLGDPFFIVEAMKMENEVVAHRAGRVGAIDVRVGDTVEVGQGLAWINVQ
jgi:acetyl-CoA/propionyl-CoA carboxylase, biotin carboxylase, biotin carboxyl carrier protein